MPDIIGISSFFTFHSNRLMSYVIMSIIKSLSVPTHVSARLMSVVIRTKLGLTFLQCRVALQERPSQIDMIA